MKHIPIVFPISFMVILVVIFFSGAYAIAEGAAAGQTGTASTQAGQGLDWYQSAAAWVCPLH